MDFVNQAYAQLVELIRSMSAGTRVATGLLLGARRGQPGVSVSISSERRRRIAARAVAAIHAKRANRDRGGLRARRASARARLTGSQIRIPRGQKDLYLAALADGNALPADFYKYLDEAIKADNPFSSPKSLEMRRWNAKQKELSLIIGRMNGIESATVQYDEEVETRPYRSKSRRRRWSPCKPAAASSTKTRSKRSATSSPRLTPASTAATSRSPI